VPCVPLAAWQRTNLISLATLLMAICSGSANVLYMVAYQEHMTDSPLRAVRERLSCYMTVNSKGHIGKVYAYLVSLCIHEAHM
jgi:hypothetical protein